LTIAARVIAYVCERSGLVTLGSFLGLDVF